MRLKESGIGTTAIVVIIVAVVIGTVIPVTVVAVLLGGGGGSLPVYPGANALNTTTYGNTTTTTYDLGTIGMADVYNWYKSEMPNQGWGQPTTDNPTTYLI